MGKCHYCSKCGNNLVTNWGSSPNIKHWLRENKITMCEECNPKLWEIAHDRIMTIENKSLKYRGIA